ncbi:MAG: hypothetical protein A2068_11990 [Ignavibacteria bacterium GWB2_35_6b]|nr:MAG: hypothetical protein A2068_11990 [Ignavibacteria bacterium GWB2_35_6b]
MKPIRKFTALLLIFNFLVLSGVISYHYHSINFTSGQHETVHEKSTDNQNKDSYTYYTCPIISYASSAFNIYFEKKNNIDSGLKVITVIPLPKANSFFFREFQLSHLRAPPSFS